MKRKGAFFFKREGDSVLYTGSYVDFYVIDDGHVSTVADRKKVLHIR